MKEGTDNMTSILIELGMYGKEGIIEMGEPSMRNLTMKDNALGNCTVTKMVDGVPIVMETRIGDAEIINTLVYVRKAPFNNTVKAFLDYCDTMEPGMDSALFERMKEVRAEIEEGKASPFADSQAAETETSV